MNNELAPAPQLVAWEITRSCNLSCAHCRASAQSGGYEGELSTEECFKLVDQIAEVGKPILILTGGEPLLRGDVFDIGKYAIGKGLRVVMGTNGTMVTEEIASRMKTVPLSRISISLDYPTPELQDEFRGAKGAFESALAGIRNAQKAGIEVQINMTVTRKNAEYLPALVGLALELGVAAFHPFMLVPTGRGKGLAQEELSPDDYESTLKWIYQKQKELGDKLNFKPTDAPHYYRIVQQCGGTVSFGHGHRPSQGQQTGHQGMNAHTRGCLAGTGFCFISHTGKVQGCGYLDIEAGDIRENTFSEVWNESPLFREIRDLSKLKGKCGRCEFKTVCGGCRARAYETSGDYLAAEPYCAYRPSGIAAGTN
ncbi:heme b synthase [Dehalogenimonas formicexedens]|uniref:Heme b synthase n=1 Tax=Dehalogenimonas formicexedens TaxID=1839801 RepID=A0A1P8F8A8_9CHLR|nr:radical SAM protein [Dehalogenimonas formicexedens]APV44697.1 heme b synthase [Dehalogenimonas formicexedens]